METNTSMYPENMTVQTLLKDKKVSGQWSVAQLLALSEDFTAHTQQSEAKYKRLRRYKILVVILAFVAVISASAAGVLLLQERLIAYGFAAFVGLLFVALILGILSRRSRSTLFFSDYWNVVKSLLEGLQDDIKPDTPVSIEFWLTPVEMKQFKQDRVDNYSTERYYKCQDSYFDRDLLTLKGRLADGNRLMLIVHELRRKTEKTKRSRSRSGKTKYKTKIKRQSRIKVDLRLIVNPDLYTCRPIPQDAAQRITKTEHRGSPLLRVRFAEKLKGAQISKNIPEHVMQDLITVYTILQPKQSDAL